MSLESEREFRERIHEKNLLRKSINEKKELYAKMVNVPECLEEALTLKSEIESLELLLTRL